LTKSVVILGAGPAGLASAYYLCKGGCTDITLLEAEKFTGGISATMRRDDMLFDFGSHRIHPACDVLNRCSATICSAGRDEARYGFQGGSWSIRSASVRSHQASDYTVPRRS